ncbi:SDR family oxidoreductase [Paracoccus sp. (in: a-proteobacteria)]|uniref:SDR family oxidoreductase n=1 Tax=Paracoccus sp. TaxID=267 RepID=UPI0026E111BA|nr:SDR family oxidoreductase [Paracoccus sp. (in: a-proteobacteria)]MDO5370201.1 SDR family oxidoreductase [Paracoccus sp. (in: a-proteobacteria)]
MRTLVTGGTRGIGRATALACAERGWPTLLGYSRNEVAAAETLAAIRAAKGTASAHAADIGDPAAVAGLFDAAEAAMGGLDAVVVNAGIVAPVMPLAEMTPERLDRMVRVNLTGALYCAREAARRLGDGGAIVLVSSVAARLGSPGKYVDYAATKGGIDTLVIGLAAELAPRRIRVNGVRPGTIATDIHADGGEPDRVATAGPQLPWGRVGRPEEVAAAILWLLSDAASYTSGAIIDVAGAR